MMEEELAYLKKQLVQTNMKQRVTATRGVNVWSGCSDEMKTQKKLKRLYN